MINNGLMQYIFFSQLCKEPYSGKTAGDAQPLSRHFCYKDGPLNSPGTLNGQRMNEGKEDKDLPDKRRSQVNV